MKKYSTLAIIALFALSLNAQTTVYDIQYTEDSGGDSPFADAEVSTFGLVVATSEDGYWIVDGDGPWSGLYIFDFDNTPSIGDSVEVSGTVQEYYNLTELGFVTEFNITSSDNELPDPIELSTSQMNMEEYEGCFVRAMDAECVNSNSGFGQWIVDDGSGEIFINPGMFDYDASQGTSYNITGVLTYSFSERKLLPRSAGDIEVFVGIEESVEIEVSVFPNPVSDQLQITLPEGKRARATLFSTDGKLVMQEILLSENSVMNLSELETGVYILNVHSEGINYSGTIEKN